MSMGRFFAIFVKVFSCEKKTIFLKFQFLDQECHSVASPPLRRDWEKAASAYSAGSKSKKAGHRAHRRSFHWWLQGKLLRRVRNRCFAAKRGPHQHQIGPRFSWRRTAELRRLRLRNRPKTRQEVTPLKRSIIEIIEAKKCEIIGLFWGHLYYFKYVALSSIWCSVLFLD